MTGNAVTCHFLTPTRNLPHPYSFDADTRPWTCLRDGLPRTLSACELERCPMCPRWEQRTFGDAMRDIAFETWGVGIEIPNERTIEDARRDIVWETFGLKV